LPEEQPECPGFCQGTLMMVVWKEEVESTVYRGEKNTSKEY